MLSHIYPTRPFATRSADTSDFDYSQVAREAAALPPADTGLSPVGAAGVAAAGFGGAALAGAALSRSGDQSKSNTNESMSLDDDGLGGATTSSRTGSKYADSDLPIEEDHFVIYAPAGKLGLVVDNPDDGAPVVHAIKEDSVLIDQVRVGDRLVGVDEIDVRSLSPVKVSKLISKRSTNPLRKLTLVRSKLDLDDDVTDVTESGISSAQASTNLETDTLMTEEKRELLRDNDNDDASSNVGSMSHLSADEDHNSIGFHDDNASFVDGMSQTGEIQDGTDDSVDVESSAKLDP